MARPWIVQVQMHRVLKTAGGQDQKEAQEAYHKIVTQLNADGWLLEGINLYKGREGYEE